MAKPLIDWHDDISHVMLNPLMPDHIKEQLLHAVEPYQDLKGHLWISSSGTENFPKMIALSKKAFLTCAQAVNEHFEITNEHIWLNILPLFHTGGLGIHARAFLSGSPLFDFSEKKWDPHKFVDRLKELNISFSSLTSTHVYDLVQEGLKPPESLQAIIVGGGALSEPLHEKAYNLGWPLHRSYGMTETCSQVATALHPHPKTQLVILNHVQMRFDADEFIEIKSEALLTGYVHGNDPERVFIDPKVDGWYKTQDKGVILADFLQIYGRGSNFMKIGGENINFSDLEIAWEGVRVKHRCHKDAVLIDIPDDRLGKKICLAVVEDLKGVDFAPMIDDFYKQVLPIAKIREVIYVEKIPRTQLYKVQREELRKLILEKK